MKMKRLTVRSKIPHTYLRLPIPRQWTFLSFYLSFILASWHHWPHKKLGTIKTKPISWSSSSKNSSRQKVMLSRLRIGNTPLSTLAGISCNYCQADNLTVQYLFSCPVLRNQQTSHNISSALCKKYECPILFITTYVRPISFHII